MIASAAFLFIPLALTTSVHPETTPLHHEVRAHVTGYNTVPAQTDSTPCIAASGANICGRRDAVACPRRISLGTTVEINGTTYVCEDRLAKKYDSRFDISCDKDKACPSRVTGWTTVKVYDKDGKEAAEVKIADSKKEAAEKAAKLAENKAKPAVKGVDVVVRQAANRAAGLVRPASAVKTAQKEQSRRVATKDNAKATPASKIAEDAPKPTAVLRGSG